MLENILKPRSVEKHPFEMFFIGIIYSSIAIPISLFIFPSNASILIVFLTVLASIQIFNAVMSLEEKKEQYAYSERWLLQEHLKAFKFFFFLFLGFAFSFVLWSILLSTETSQLVFSSQKEAVQGVTHVTGQFTNMLHLKTIIWNNLKVLAISFFFSFVYGAGVIFILTWNASVIGFVIGNYIRYETGLSSIPVAVTRYLSHGIVEILAYFSIALAGGIISVSIMRKDFRKGNFRTIFIDVIALVLISLILVLAAGIIEVYISPNI